MAESADEPIAAVREGGRHWVAIGGRSPGGRSSGEPAGVLAGVPFTGIIFGVLIAVLAFLGRPVIDLFARMATN